MLRGGMIRSRWQSGGEEAAGSRLQRIAERSPGWLHAGPARRFRAIGRGVMAAKDRRVADLMMCLPKTVCSVACSVAFAVTATARKGGRAGMTFAVVSSAGSLSGNGDSPPRRAG